MGKNRHLAPVGSRLASQPCAMKVWQCPCINQQTSFWSSERESTNFSVVLLLLSSSSIYLVDDNCLGMQYHHRARSHQGSPQASNLQRQHFLRIVGSVALASLGSVVWQQTRSARSYWHSSMAMMLAKKKTIQLVSWSSHHNVVLLTTRPTYLPRYLPRYTQLEARASRYYTSVE